MKARFQYFLFWFFLFLSGCEEFKSELLLKTELENNSETQIKIRGNLLDIPEGLEIISYGHCWSDKSDPTINDSTTLFEFTKDILKGHSFTYLSTIDDFTGNKTYFIKSYLILKNNEVRYGNTLTVNSEQTRGRWSRIADHWYPTQSKKIEDDGSGCGIAEQHITTYNLFANAGFYQDKILAHSGFKFVGSSKDYENPCNNGVYGYPEGAGWGQWRNNQVRLFDGNSWTVNSIIGSSNLGGLGIVNNGILYTGGGLDAIGNYEVPLYEMYAEGDLVWNTDFNALDIQNNVLLPLQPIPFESFFDTYFLLNNKIYILGVGVYDIASGDWLEGIHLPGKIGMHSVAFVINGKAYVGSGFMNIKTRYWEEGYEASFGLPESPTNEFWEYSPDTDTWRRIADFPGEARGGAFAFGMKGFGYVGCGTTGLFNKYLKDFWRYDPSTDKWKQLDDFPGGRRFGSVGFANENIGCAGLGYVIKEDEPLTIDDQYFNLFKCSPQSDFWIYDPSKN